MKTASKLLVLLLASGGAAVSVVAQGTAFQYQGRLNYSGSPVTGIYDLRFTIYDSLAGATVVAGPQSLPGTGVTNGLVSVTLDFGPGVFIGPGRWLEIGVRPNGGATYTNLSPRQPLLPTPYAIHSGTASNVANGSVVKSLNNLRDNVTLAAGANVTLTPSGNTLTIAATGVGGGPWSLNGANAFYNGGNVGIGTSTPNHRLSISGGPFWTTAFWGGALELDNASAIGWRANASGNRFGIGQTTGGLSVFATASDPGNTANPPNYLMTFDDFGKVGIGTATPAQRLTVNQSGYGIEHTDGNVRLSTFVGGSTGGGWLGTISNHKLSFFANDSTALMTVDTTGNVGIGTTTPGSRLTVFRPSSLFTGNYGVEHTDGTVRLSTYLDGSGGWLGTISSHPLKFYVANGGASLTIDTAGNVGVGTASPAAKLDVNGTTRTRILTITGGADIAEPFQMSTDEIPKGAVVVIDEENPGRLKLSSSAYDTRVAGVVSGANGIRPGISLHQEGALEGGENVALSGRVYVQADATAGGAIKPGDLLTTSATPGHAMKVGDHAKAQGAILGKAMTGLKEGRGMVLLLVTLQ